MLREGTWLCEGLLDEGNFVARVFDEKIALEYVRTYLTLVFKCCILHLINVALALVFSQKIIHSVRNCFRKGMVFCALKGDYEIELFKERVLRNVEHE